eukprot:GFKZ01009046.1.p1 GENE.GFKZ01009046.1~~GFKZ01009046.1.p1  ORF type:complete len:499 (-),score=66.65 GFKZ01009046.1:1655-3061(-)
MRPHHTSHPNDFPPPSHFSNSMNPTSWLHSSGDDHSSSDDSLFAAAAAASANSSHPPSTPSDPIFPFSSFPSPNRTNTQSSLAPNSPTPTTFRQAPSLFDSDDSSEDDALFPFSTSSTTTRRPRKPRAIIGSKTSFILGGKLGEGAYATVREGIDEQSLRMVAVKVLDLRRLRRLRGGLDAIEREVAVQKRLKRHPNLIELIDVIRAPEKGKMYIILEMANGCTVQQLAEKAENHRLPESQVASYAYQTLKGLQYMHEKGVVHRDIKPSNMILTAAGDLKISDFGVAEFLNEYQNDDNVTRTSGSPAFQAPEVATGALGYSGRKVDVWALGVTVYYLLTGTIPFEAGNLITLFELIGNGDYHEPEWLNDSCKDVLRSMLTVDWEKRISIDELLRHPWIQRGNTHYTQKQREDRGWVPIPKKDLRILEMVNDFYSGEEPTQPSTTSSLASASVPAHGARSDHQTACIVA